MFDFRKLVPFGVGDPCTLFVRKGLIKLRGRAEIRRLCADKLVITAHIPRQGLIVPEVKLRYAYHLDPERTVADVKIGWNGRTFRDDRAIFTPDASGTVVRVDMLFDRKKDWRLGYRIARGGPAKLMIDDVSGVPLTAGAEITLEGAPER